MDKIKIIHISDLHISEHLTRGASKQYKLPARYGHDIQVFLALDKFLKETQWDILLITGDLTRIGNSESFESIRNWLENQISIGSYTLGLNLSKSETRSYFVIPGNHDRFNGELTQNSLDKYHHEFLPITSGDVKSLYVGKNKVNIHLYDSTQNNNSFAYGYIDEKSLIPPTCPEGELNLALLHHHFIQPPKHERTASTELINSADVAAYFLNGGFDGVLFGHTHQSYIGNPSIKALSGILKDKRTIGRLWRRILPKYILRKLEGNCLVSYKRESAQNGQLPTLESYFDYLIIKKHNKKIKGPTFPHQLVTRPGLEPGTHGLRVRCSAKLS